MFLAALLVALAARSVIEAHGTLRMALVTALLVWAVTSLVATVEGNRTTWLLFALIVLAARLTEEDSQAMAACFSASPRRTAHAPAPPLAVQALKDV